MQIVSEALFAKLPSKAIQYSNTHNKIIYLTRSEVIVRNVDIECRCQSFSFKEGEIMTFWVENNSSLILLYKSGLLEIRSLERLEEVLFKFENIGYSVNKNNQKIVYPEVKLSTNLIYFMYEHIVETRNLISQSMPDRWQISEGSGEEAQHILISNMISEGDVVLVQFESFIAFTFESIVITLLELQEINCMKILDNPLQIQKITRNWEYLVVINEKKWLKVYRIMSLRIVFEMQIAVEKDEQVSIKSDPLNEYVIIQIWDSKSKATISNHLLKVNKRYFTEQPLALANEPFFLFEIELGIKEDLFLFPTHRQTFNHKQCHSIDMCYFKQATEIQIVTLVIEENYQSKIHQSQINGFAIKVDQSWDEFVSTLNKANLLSFEPAIRLGVEDIEFKAESKKNQTKMVSLKGKGADQGNNNLEPISSDEWELFLTRFLNEKYPYKADSFHLENDRPRAQSLLSRSFSNPNSKLEYEDIWQTLSGSSSLQSFNTSRQDHEERFLKMIECEISSVEDQKIHTENPHLEKIDPKSAPQKQSNSDPFEGKLPDGENSGDEDPFFVDEPFQVEICRVAQAVVDNQSQKIASQIHKIDEITHRIEQIHCLKLKSIQEKVQAHVKDCTQIEGIVTKVVDKQLSILSIHIKDSFKLFNSTIGKLELLQIRSLKKMKKNYHDFVQEQLDSAWQEVEEGEESVVKIEELIKSFRG